jgi:2-haloacid dehalogenase
MLKIEKGILFDINETVLNLNILRPKFALYLGNENFMDTWFFMLLHSSTVCLATEVKTDFSRLALATLKSLAGRLGKTLSDEHYDDILSTFSNLPTHDDIEPALTKLRNVGFKLIAFSNSSASLLKSQLINSGLVNYFDDAISVESAGTFKPSLSGYQYAIKKLSMPPNNIRLVATHDWDTHGALCAGLKAAFINRFKGPYNPLYKMPDITGKSMEEIAELIIKKECSNIYTP